MSNRKKNILLDSKVPEGDLSEKWTNYKSNMKLVNPANKRKFNVIVVGGLAGASHQQHYLNLVITLKHLLFMTHLDVLIVLLLKVVLMLAIKMMEQYSQTFLRYD